GTGLPQYVQSMYARFFSRATFSRHATSRGQRRHAVTSRFSVASARGTLTSRHHSRRLDPRQAARLQQLVDLWQLDRNPAIEILRDVAHLAADRAGPLHLLLRRPAVVADDASIQLREGLAQPLLTRDHAAFLRRDDLLAHRVPLRRAACERAEQGIGGGETRFAI